MTDFVKAGNVWQKILAEAEKMAKAEKKAAALQSVVAQPQAPAVLMPSGLNELKEAVRQKKGNYGAKRVERAADEIKNLERLYTTDALKEAFIGDNARALMTMNPKDFERYATPIPKGISGPQEFRGYGNQFHNESMKNMTLSDYLDNLSNVKGGFADVPYLIINKEEQGLPLTPFISGHEGRHRSRALAKQGEEAGLVQLLPRSELREPFPRLNQEEYIEALRKELGMTDNLVLPQKYNEPSESLFDKQIQRPAIKLPEIYADGGKVVRGLMGALAKANEMAKLERKAALEASERALPMRLARAPAKSDAEIASHAERVGRQMLGEHVMSGKPGKTVNLAGRSMRENDRIKGVQYELKNTKDLPKSEVVESKIGDVNVAFPGDYTLSDVELVSVNGRPIGSKQEGGSRYGQGKLDMDEPVFWASGEGPAQLAQDKITDSAHFFNPERVMAHHLAMGPVATNFAQHFADANLRSMDLSRLSKEDIDKFDRMIAAGYEKKHPKTGERQLFAFPEWPGIANREEAYEAMKADPELRKWFNSRMKTPKDTKASNLPNGLDIQWAITSPDLRNMEVNLTGHSVGEMVPEAALTDTANHNTYEKGIRGLYKGHQQLLTPFVLSFPDAAQHIASTQEPKDFTGTIQKVFPHQIVDQQHIDELGKYYEKLNRVIQGKKKGGAVGKLKKPHWYDDFHRRMAKGGVVFTDKDAVDNFLMVRHKAEGGDADDVSVKELARNMGKIAKEQGEKEFNSLKKPRAIMDVANRGILAPALGSPVDLINMGLGGIDALTAYSANPTRLASEKPFGGQEHIKDLMNEYGWTTGEDRPLMETTLSFFSPTGMIKGAQKTGELAKKLPDFVRKIESGLGSLSKKH